MPLLHRMNDIVNVLTSFSINAFMKHMNMAQPINDSS